MKTSSILAAVAAAVLLSPGAHATAAGSTSAMAALCEKDAARCEQLQKRFEAACAKGTKACDRATQKLQQRAAQLANGKKGHKARKSAAPPATPQQSG